MKKLLALLLFSGSLFAQSVPNRQVDIGVLPPVTIGNLSLPVTGTVSIGNNVSVTVGNNVQVTVTNQPVNQSVTVTNTPSFVKANDDIEQRAIREGAIWPMGVRTDNFIWTGLSQSGGQNVASVSPPTGFSYYLKSINYSASRVLEVQSLYGQYQVGNYPAQFGTFVIGPSGSSVLVNAMLQHGMTYPGVSVVSVNEADPRTVLASAVSGLINIASTKSQYNTPLTNNLYSYSITAQNTSGASLTGITVTDVLPAGCRYIAGSGSGWTVSATSNTITATTSTSLANTISSTPISITVAPTVSFNVGLTTSGYIMDMDQDYSCPNVILMCGTSISFGTGATSYKTMWSMQLRNWLRDTYNYPVRRINRGVSGSTTSHHEDFRKYNNRYDIDAKTGILLYEHGINNVVQAVPTATSQADLLAMIRHKQKKYPLMTMLVLAPFPVLDATNETGLATLSTALAATVASVNDPKVIYITSTRTCLVPATDLTDGIHPNDAGQTKIATAIQTFITTNNIQF